MMMVVVVMMMMKMMVMDNVYVYIIIYIHIYTCTAFMAVSGDIKWDMIYIYTLQLKEVLSIYHQYNRQEQLWNDGRISTAKTGVDKVSFQELSWCITPIARWNKWQQAYICLSSLVSLLNSQNKVNNLRLANIYHDQYPNVGSTVWIHLKTASLSWGVYSFFLICIEMKNILVDSFFCGDSYQANHKKKHFVVCPHLSHENRRKSHRYETWHPHLADGRFLLRWWCHLRRVKTCVSFGWFRILPFWNT